jgi:DNA-binding beta-propeller fold protein YncE
VFNKIIKLVVIGLSALFVSCNGKDIYGPLMESVSVVRYPEQGYILTQGSSIMITPTLMGAAPTNITMYPLLPGLTIDSTTGVISGIPANPQTVVTYTISATTEYGSRSTNITIAVKSAGPVNNCIYVANRAGPTVSYLNATNGGTLVTKTLPSGSGPYSLTVNSVENILYVTDIYLNQLYFLDARNGTILGTFQTGTSPYTVALNTTANILYVANSGDSTVTFFNALTGAYLNGSLSNSSFVTGIYPTGSNPKCIAVDPSNNILYVVNYFDASVNGTITFFNATTGAYLNGTLPLSSVTTLLQPQGVILDSSGSLYVLGFSGFSTPAHITQHNATTGAPINNYDIDSTLGPSTFGFAIDPATGYFFAVDTANNRIHLIDTGGTPPYGTVINGTGLQPFKVAVSGNKVYVVNSGDNNVTFFNTTGGVISGTVSGSPFTVGNNPNGIAVAP